MYDSTGGNVNPACCIWGTIYQISLLALGVGIIMVSATEMGYSYHQKCSENFEQDICEVLKIDRHEEWNGAGYSYTKITYHLHPIKQPESNVWIEPERIFTLMDKFRGPIINSSYAFRNGSWTHTEECWHEKNLTSTSWIVFVPQRGMDYFSSLRTVGAVTLAIAFILAICLAGVGNSQAWCCEGFSTAILTSVFGISLLLAGVIGLVADLKPFPIHEVSTCLVAFGAAISFLAAGLDIRMCLLCCGAPKSKRAWLERQRSKNANQTIDLVVRKKASRSQKPSDKNQPNNDYHLFVSEEEPSVSDRVKF